MIDLRTAVDVGPLPACPHLAEWIAWRVPPTWCGCADLLRCHRCYSEHSAAVHATVPVCEGENCGYVFGPESIDHHGRHSVGRTYPFATVDVSFPTVSGAVMDFHDVTIFATRILCLACAWDARPRRVP